MSLRRADNGEWAGERMNAAQKRKRWFLFRPQNALFLWALLIGSGVAIAAVCALNQPWDAPITDTYKMRDKHPVSGAANKPHRGVDLSKPGSSDCNDPVVLRDGCTVEKYTQYGGYGNTLIRDCGNGVKELYGHLNGFNESANTAFVGSTGGSTGCHLHYEVIIDGVTVDPQCVWGTGTNCPTTSSGTTSQANLCDAAQREALKQNAQQKLGSQANSPVISGGNAVDGKTPATPSTGTGGSTGGTGGTTGGTGGTTGGTGGTTGGTGGGTGIDTDTDEPITTGGGTTTPPPPPPPPPAPTQGGTGAAGGGTNPGGGVIVPPAGTGQGEITRCAPDTWTAMINQAGMEARREVVMNQTYILKPDSVLQYACIAEGFKNTMDKAGPVFSESEYWNPIQVDISGKSKEKPKTKVLELKKSLGTTSLDNAVSAAAYNIMSTYLQDNYNHTMLGGTANLSPSGCDLMKKVWAAARCTNFSQEKVFYTFEELANVDPRVYPANMTCDKTGITQEQIDLAKNKNQQPAKVTPVKSYKEYLTHEGGCALTINTGVSVYRREVMQGTTPSTPQPYPDTVCTNAGCTPRKNGQCQQ